MPILGTVSSGYVEMPYELSQTFNTSGTYTVPAGKTKVAVYVIGGGGGTGLSPYTNRGMPCAGGGGAGAIVDYSVSP